MRTVVIGAGRMGLRHLEVANQLDLEVVGVCDTDLDRARSAVTADFPLAAVGSDFEQMLRDIRPDLVVVATTAPSHCAATLAAAASGAQFILCEKPMARSLRECQMMIDACSASGARLAVNHPMRFMGHYLAAREAVESVDLGGLVSISVTAGNFGMGMNGVHYFELLRWMTGESPMTVQAWFSDEVVPNPRGPEFHDVGGQIRATTASGTSLYLNAPPGQGHGLTVLYGCRHGQVVLDELAGWMRLSSRAEQDRSLPSTRYGTPAKTGERAVPPADVVGPTAALTTALIGGANFPDGGQGRQALATLVAAHVSAGSGGAPVSASHLRLPNDLVLPLA